MRAEDADAIVRDARFDRALEEALREGGEDRLVVVEPRAWPKWSAVAAAVAIGAWGIWLAFVDGGDGREAIVVEQPADPVPVRLVESEELQGEDPIDREPEQEAADPAVTARTIAALEYFVLPSYQTGGGDWEAVMGEFSSLMAPSDRRRPIAGMGEIIFTAPAEIPGQELGAAAAADLRHVSVWSALRYVAVRSGFEVEVRGSEITLVPLEEGDEIIDRDIRVAPGFGARPLEALASDSRYFPSDLGEDPFGDDPFATDARMPANDSRTLKQRLGDWGVTFPARASVDGDPEKSMIQMTNTGANIALVEVLSSLHGGQPQVFLTSKLVLAPTTVFDAADDQRLTDPEFQIVMRTLNETKGVNLLTAPSVVVRNTQRAKVELVKEVAVSVDESVHVGWWIETEPECDGDLIRLGGEVVWQDIVDSEDPEGLVALLGLQGQPNEDGSPSVDRGVDYDVWLAPGETAMMRAFDTVDARTVWIFLTPSRLDAAGASLRVE